MRFRAFWNRQLGVGQLIPNKIAAGRNCDPRLSILRRKSGQTMTVAEQDRKTPWPHGWGGQTLAVSAQRDRNHRVGLTGERRAVLTRALGDVVDELHAAAHLPEDRVLAVQE